MIHRTDHFGHREAAGIVVGLFWDRCDLHDEFCAEAKGRLDGTRFGIGAGRLTQPAGKRRPRRGSSRMDTYGPARMGHR